MLALFLVVLGSYAWIRIDSAKRILEIYCVRSYTALEKGVFWEGGEWHHYVEFAVDSDVPSEHHWRVKKAPLPSSILNSFLMENTVRATYAWPSDWKDPFPTELWEICRVEW